MTPPHAVQFYNDDVFLIDTVSAFITAGIKENGAIIVIATAQHREELRNTLQAANNSSITSMLLSYYQLSWWMIGRMRHDSPRRSGLSFNGPL